MAIETHLRERERRREELHERARQLRRLAQATMIALHEYARAPPPSGALREALRELAEWVRQEARGDESLAQDAIQEAVEGLLLTAVVEGTPLPGPGDLGVEPEPFLLGAGDLVGEVRRLALSALGRDDLEGAERYLRLMDELFHTLMRFDTTRAIVPLKPKQDVARQLLERTRGEVVMARVLRRAPPRAPSTEDTR